MKRTVQAAALFGMLTALLLVSGLLPQAKRASGSAHAHVQTAVATPAPASTLFPNLSENAITAITVATPDRSFHFLCEDPHSVSVNGRQADREVFLTLLEQIAELPVEGFYAFSPEKQEPILTLTISSGPAQQTARFYADGKRGEKVHIVAGTSDKPEYRTTGGWRVGALMMTCEGTRIQDAHGNEIPASK